MNPDCNFFAYDLVFDYDFVFDYTEVYNENANRLKLNQLKQSNDYKPINKTKVDKYIKNKQ